MRNRKPLKLVEDGRVDGWDDPRMSTLAGMRRQGITPDSIREFSAHIGIAKRENWIELGLLEKFIRDDLNTTTRRVMCVLDPLKVVVENYPEDASDDFDCPCFPDDPPQVGSRSVPFTREIFIEREDFMENPSRKFHRLAS